MTMICIICFNNHAEDDCPDFVSSSRMNGTEKKPSSSLTRNLSKYILKTFILLINIVQSRGLGMIDYDSFCLKSYHVFS